MSKLGTKTTTQPIEFVKAKELLTKLKYDKDYQNLLLFTCGFYFGMRISDILQLTWVQVQSNELSFYEGKTGKHRTIPIQDDVKVIIELCKRNLGNDKPNDFLFRYRRAGAAKKPTTVQAANKRIKVVFYKYAIDTVNPSSHTLRKTFGKAVYKANGESEASLVLLSDIFNHRDIATTRKYIGLTKQVKANAYLSL